MGNPKFKLSDMIPNSWFYMLKDMNKSSKTTHSKLKKHHLPPPPAPPSSPPTSFTKTPLQPPQPEPLYHARKSYHITRELVNPPANHDSYLLHSPRKSKSSTKSRKSSRRSSSTSSCSCKSTLTTQSCHSKSHSPSPSPLRETDKNIVGFFVENALLTPTKEHVKQSILDRNALPLAKHQPEVEHFDIVIDVDEKSLRKTNINNFDFQLPPIITRTKQKSKPRKNVINKEHKLTNTVMISKESKYNPPSRRFSVSSPAGMRLKINSPRIVGKKQGQNGNFTSGRRSTSSKKRRSISESFAVVKSSRDPQRDFWESMVEMIVQNNLRGTKDLEELLACYLSLNSDEYHEVIISVFKQIWLEFRQYRK